MSVMIHPGTEFLGLPLRTARDVLKAWRYGQSKDAHDIAIRRDVDLDPRTVMVLLDEFRDRGLIGPEEREYETIDGLSERGMALAGATAKQRTSKERAWQILEQLVENSTRINARDDLPFYVRKIWLFGSMLDPEKPEKPDVADIDVVVEIGRPKRFEENFLQHFKKLALEMGGESAVNAPGIASILRPQTFVVNKLLYSGRKGIIAENDIDTLKDLACPCQLVFCAEDGGRVEGRLYERHPQSNGRSNRIREQRTMPNLLEGRRSLHPLPAKLIDPNFYHFKSIVGMGPWPDQDAPNRLVGYRHLTIATDDAWTRKIKQNVVTKRLNLTNLDPRHRVGIIVTESIYPNPERQWESIQVPGFGVVVERSIQEKLGKIFYSVRIADGAPLDLLRRQGF